MYLIKSFSKSDQWIAFSLESNTEISDLVRGFIDWLILTEELLVSIDRFYFFFYLFVFVL